MRTHTFILIAAIGRRFSRTAAHVSCFVFLLCLPAGTVSGESTGYASDSEEAAVLAIVDQLFDGMRNKDRELLAGVFAPEARLGNSSIDGFIEQVVGSEAYLDEVTFDEVVLVDGDLAMAWTPYNLFVSDLFYHCGVDLFVMRRIDGLWKVVQLDDTRRTAGCDTKRR